MSAYDVSTFEEFWPFYVRMHARAATQRLHALATLTAAALAIAGACLRQPLLIVAAPLADHLIAQLAHRFCEGNATQPLRKPSWHARAELRMFRLVLTGRMRAETRRCLLA
jgi:hypothetical protein